LCDSIAENNLKGHMILSNEDVLSFCFDEFWTGRWHVYQILLVL